MALLFAWSGNRIGIHPFSAAFLGGLTAPRHLRNAFARRLEPFVILLPVPVFFAITGLRTHLDLAQAPGIWSDLLLVVFVATASKSAGTTLGGRIGGAPWRTALWLGALMNTRGLVELIVLNAGMERGILSPDLFSIMVSMALVTTFLTAPLLDWICS